MCVRVNVVYKFNINCLRTLTRRYNAPRDSYPVKIVTFEGGLFSFHPSSIDNFRPVQSIVACCVVHRRKILLLKRNSKSTASNTWCMPGGRLEQNESPLQAVIRETKEETGIVLYPDQINLVKTICVRILAPRQDYLLHLFRSELAESKDCQVLLNHEHTDYLWTELEAAKNLDLIPSGKEILQRIYQTDTVKLESGLE